MRKLLLRRSTKNSKKILQDLKKKSENFWVKNGEIMSLRLFREMSQGVPAYKDFLKKNKINPSKIKTYKDFKSLPVISKKNYLRRYPLEKLVWKGSLKKHLVFTSTSGSTGVPFYFPRQEKLDWQYSILSELFLKNSSLDQKGPVLLIVGFGMGVWIGGLITYKAFEIAAQRENYPLSILTPGINKTEIFDAIKRLAPHYKQIILAGYPPFVKDIIDQAPNQGINLKKLNIRLLFAAESFPEKFRDYLVKKAGIKNTYLDTLNIYGSADIGAMAFETPISILIRKLSDKRQKLFQEIFSQTQRTLTLAQYNPLFVVFEEVEGEIVLTGENVLPLVRYSIGDRGGVFSFKDVILKMKKHGIDFKKEILTAGIQNNVYRLPFVYVYERSDFSTTIYGLQIYPEMIREALFNKDIVKFLTGKFSMITKFDRKHNQYLEINIELRKKVKLKKSSNEKVKNKIVQNLLTRSSEFRELYNYLKSRTPIRLIFWPYEHPQYFKPGIKQKWVI